MAATSRLKGKDFLTLGSHCELVCRTQLSESNREETDAICLGSRVLCSQRSSERGKTEVQAQGEEPGSPFPPEKGKVLPQLKAVPAPPAQE